MANYTSSPKGPNIFTVNIHRKNDNSCQGSITLDNNRQAGFGSALELFQLIDSALVAQNGPNGKRLLPGAL